MEKKRGVLPSCISFFRQQIWYRSRHWYLWNLFSLSFSLFFSFSSLVSFFVVDCIPDVGGSIFWDVYMRLLEQMGIIMNSKTEIQTRFKLFKIRSTIIVMSWVITGWERNHLLLLSVTIARPVSSSLSFPLNIWVYIKKSLTTLLLPRSAAASCYCHIHHSHIEKPIKRYVVSLSLSRFIVLKSS